MAVQAGHAGSVRHPGLFEEICSVFFLLFICVFSANKKKTSGFIMPNLRVDLMERIKTQFELQVAATYKITL